MTTYSSDSVSQDVPSSRRKALGALAVGAGAAALSVKAAPESSAATIARSDMANAIGFYPVLSPLPPTMVSIGLVPVYWIQEASPTDAAGKITVTPVTPWFDDANAYWRVPNGVIGVDYQDGDGKSILPGQVNIVTQVPASVTIKAVAREGYQLDSRAVSSWSHTFVRAASNNIITSDTFTGAAGLALSSRSTDKGIGGNPSQWQKSGGEAFILSGSGSAVNTSSTGSYSLTSGKNDVHVSYKVSFLNRDASGRNGANGTIVSSIGGNPNVQTMGLIHNATTWQAYVMTSSGATIVDSGNVTVDGYYIIEVIGNQFGYKAPGFDEMRYYDVSNKLTAARGNSFSVFSNDTVANTVSLAGVQVVNISSS